MADKIHTYQHNVPAELPDEVTAAMECLAQICKNCGIAKVEPIFADGKLLYAFVDGELHEWHPGYWTKTVRIDGGERR